MSLRCQARRVSGVTMPATSAKSFRPSALPFTASRCRSSSMRRSFLPVLSKNTNELKTGAPGRFDRHRPVASPDLGRVGGDVSDSGSRTRRENTVQQRDATLPGGDLGSRPGPHMDQNVLAGYAAVALALILDPSGGLFSDAARPCQRPAPPFGANVALENRD